MQAPGGQIEPQCDFCHRSCRPRRCARCRKAIYCSAACQKADWKTRHRPACRPHPPAEGQVRDAWMELQKSLCSLTSEQVFHEMQKAQAEIENIQFTDKEHGRSETTSARRDKIKPEMNNMKEDQATGREDCAMLILGEESTSSSGNRKRTWTYVVEEKNSISCYQVFLRPNGGQDLKCLSSFRLSFKPLHNNHTLVQLHQNLDKQPVEVLAAEFPTQLISSSSDNPDAEPTNSIQREGSCLCLRLQSQDVLLEGADVLVPDTISTTDQQLVNGVCCRFCDQPLLRGMGRIQRVLPLPSGLWDEITEYLICYNGQPVLDFSSNSMVAQTLVAFEDASVLVLHRQNVGESVCVLAVEGYGDVERTDEGFDKETAREDSVVCRGSRRWQDSVGGASLCCSNCCAPLGFASIESRDTLRLLKHRLKLSPRDDFRKHTCATFVATEMVRYAKSKAVFTFKISIRPEERNAIEDGNLNCLMLKLLSWDTRLAFSRDSQLDAAKGVDMLQFRRVAKVVYEVTHDRLRGENDDLTTWKWGGVDICCEPVASSKSPSEIGPPISEIHSFNSSVQLYLSGSEWNELRQAVIDNSPLFSKTVVDATSLVKLGKRASGHPNECMGMSALPLL